jgi:general secretion pathway protein K
MRAGLQIRRAGRPDERGAALLVAMVAIAILTALAVDLAYEARVRLQIAANGRDELRATYLAKSGVNLGRLVLSFQQQLNQATQAGGQLINMATGGAQGQTAGKQPPQTTGQAGQPGPQGAGGGMPSVQIWNLVPVNSGLVGALFQGGGKAPVLPEGTAKVAPPIGDFGGAFEAKIEDEGTKVNLQLDSPYGKVDPLLAFQVEGYLRLVCDPRWDPLFEREDETGQKWTRQDVAVHLRDWADDDEVSSTLAAAFPAGNCSFQVAASPFDPGFGDENSPYDRGRDRYKAKNARLDSVEELHLVAGVSDAFMAAFGDAVTVYMPRGVGMNVNTNDPVEQLRIAWLMSEPGPTQALLADPTFLERLHKALSDVRMGGLLTISPTDFAKLVDGLGVPVKGLYVTPNNPKNPFTDRSIAYRIRATGSAGSVTKNLEAVVTFDPSQQSTDAAQTPGQPTTGRLIHWREE